MISGLQVGTELKRFNRSKLGRIAILAVILMPLMYSALYLWAFWNPFGHVNRLPVAFVNSDEGTTVDGKKLNAGDEVVENLKKQDRIDFTYVSHDEAQEGVKNGKYYFAVELTPDFSKAVASPSGTHAEKAVLKATYNSTNGYLSTLIGENAMRTLVPILSETIGEKAIDKVLVGLQDAGTGFAQASEGAGKLHDGAAKLHGGLERAEKGVGELDDGIGRAYDGSQKLAAGTQKLDSKMGELVAGTNQLADGTTQLRTRLDQSVAPLTELAQGAGRIEQNIDGAAAGAKELNTGVQELMVLANDGKTWQTQRAAEVRSIESQLRQLNDPAAVNAANQLAQLAQGLESRGLGPQSPVQAKLGAVSDGTQKLDSELNDPNSKLRSTLGAVATDDGSLPQPLQQLISGVHQLDDGAHKLQDGSQRLKAEGTGPVAANTVKLSDGLGKLDSGVDKLNAKMPEAVDGSQKLVDGTDLLSTKLGDGAKKIPAWNPSERVRSANVLGGPVSLQASDNAGQQTFGSGLAPFFFSLAMFIGGLITFLLLNPMSNRAIAAGISPLRAALVGLWPGAIVAGLQGTMIVLVTMWAVGMEMAHPLGLWFFAVAVAVMFVAINQFLNVALGPGPGKVMAMAFLMLQILSSNGLYPVQTEPKLFQWLHPVNPMTYSINGFRQLMYGNVDHRLGISIAVVLGIIILCVTLTAVVARQHRVWTMKRLHPPINV